MKRMRKMMNKRGFTLIELIVVLAILGVILAIAVPRYNGLQEAAQVKADKSSSALIIKSARLMEANENLTGDVVAELGTDDELDVTADGIESDIVYYAADAANISQSTDAAFVLTYDGTAEKYEVDAGSFNYVEGAPIN